MAFIRSNRPWGRLVAIALVACAPQLAHAEGAVPAPSASEPASADKPSPSKVLFAEGRKLAQAGHYAEACPKFEDSLRMNMGVGTQFNLADCWEHLGKTSSAYALFLGVAASAHASGQTEREGLARDRATALEPRLSHLLIDVASPVDGLVVRRNHIPVSREAWGTDSVVDPGKYTIEASAPGKKSWSESVDVVLFASAPVMVSVPALEDAQPDTAPASEPASAPESVPTPHSEPPEPLPPPHRSARRTAFALSLAAAGASGVIAGIVLGLDSRAQNDRATQICPSSVDCTDRQIQVHDHKVQNAKMFRTWSIVGFSAGGVALAGAAYLFFGPPPQAKRPERAWTLTPVVSPDGTVGATAEGRF